MESACGVQIEEKNKTDISLKNKKTILKNKNFNGQVLPNKNFAGQISKWNGQLPICRPTGCANDIMWEHMQ